MFLKSTRGVVSALLFGIVGIAVAQDYPNRPLRLINPAQPGGSSDPIARMIAQKLSESLGQPIVVESQPGAATMIGTEAATKATADGYTLLFGSSSMAIIPSMRKLSFDARKDLAPVAMLVHSPNILAVHATLPINSVAELIAYAKANPGKLAYGSSGNGATNHLATELLKSMAKVDLLHVPYKSGGAALTGFMGGQTHLLFAPPSSMMPQAKSGKFRMLAVTSPTPVPGIDLPTLSESGLAGFESSVWFALFVPAGTPQPVVDRLNVEVNRVLKDKGVQERLLQAGFVPAGGKPEELGAYLREDTARWAKVVKESGAKLD